MAQLALPLLGAAIAPSLGFAATTGWLVGSVLSSFMGGPRKGRPTIHESGVQSIQEGAPIPIVFGTAPVTGNVIAAGPMRKVETPIKQSKGGSKVVGTDVQYFCTYAVEYAKGEIGDILLAKRDGKIVYDTRPGANFDADNAAFLAKCRIYTGTEEQMPDPALEAIFGAGEVSAHRGIAYIVFEDHEQTDRGGSLSQWEFVVGAAVVEIAVPSVGSELLYAAAGTGIIEADELQIGTSDPIASQPLMGAINWQILGYAPRRFQIIDSGTGAIYGDSGWCGDPADQAALNNTLTVNGRSDLIGDISQWAGGYLPNEEIVDPENNQGLLCLGNVPEGVTHVRFRALMAYAGTAATGLINDRWLQTDPDEAPEGYTAHPTIKGVGVAPDGSLFAADFSNIEYVTLRGNGQPEKLGNIVANMHFLTGADGPVVSDLMDIEVPGLPLASPDYTGADVIDMLRSLYMFDRIEKDGQTHYELRGKPVVATITEDDLVDEDEEAQREASLMFPRKLLLTHLNPNANYETSTPPPSTRYSPDVRVQGEQSVSFPVVMDEEEAAKRAAILHKVAWVEAEGEVKFSLPYRWIWLTPGDCVILTARGQSRRVRIDEIEESDFVLKITGRVDRASAYNANPIFIPLVPPEPPVSTVPGDTTLAVLDIPAIVEQDDVLVMRLAVVGGAQGWRGAVVQRSLDAGETFADVTSLGASTMGTLVDAISSASEHYTDTTNQVRVQMLRTGLELNSISESAFLGSGGTFALEKADGSFELMQYLDAEDEGDGVFLLTTLHRGLLNSKPAAHSVGAKFVLLSDTVAVSAQSTWLGQELVHRAPSVGTSPEEADQQTMTYAGRSQLEWPVDQLSLGRDGGDIITGTWVPRHRFGSDTNPVASINFQGFRVTLDDGTDTVVIDTTDTTFTHDASAMDSPVSVSVVALNRIAGPGEAVTEDI